MFISCVYCWLFCALYALLAALDYLTWWCTELCVLLDASLSASLCAVHLCVQCWVHWTIWHDTWLGEQRWVYCSVLNCAHCCVHYCWIIVWIRLFDYWTIWLLLSAFDYLTWWWARTGGLCARPTRCHLRPPAAHAASMPPLFEMIISIIGISIIINASLVCNDRLSASSASASSSMPSLFEMVISIISISSISRAPMLPYACEDISLLGFSDYSKPNFLSKVSFLIFQFLFQMK